MLAEITALIIAYKYWAIVPLALVEAPLLSIVVGFFAMTGQLSLFLAFGIIVMGDFVGDTFLYVLGRWGRPILDKVGLHLKISAAQVQAALDYFGRNDRRAIVTSKLVHGVGFTGLFVAGSAKVPYRRFAITCVVMTISQSAVLVAIGMLSGRAYQSFAHYLGYFNIIATAAFLLVIIVLYRMLLRTIGRENLGG
jgi:membrane-associated protein